MYNSTIVDDVVNHVDARGWGDYGWYVGIATDVKTRLFTDHKVDEANGVWIYRKASSETEARDTEKELLEQKNFKGGPGGGDHPLYVYAYKITKTTFES